MILPMQRCLNRTFAWWTFVPLHCCESVSLPIPNLEPLQLNTEVTLPHETTYCMKPDLFFSFFCVIMRSLWSCLIARICSTWHTLHTSTYFSFSIPPAHNVSRAYLNVSSFDEFNVENVSFHVYLSILSIPCQCKLSDTNNFILLLGELYCK